MDIFTTDPLLAYIRKEGKFPDVPDVGTYFKGLLYELKRNPSHLIDNFQEGGRIFKVNMLCFVDEEGIYRVSNELLRRLSERDIHYLDLEGPVPFTAVNDMAAIQILEKTLEKYNARISTAQMGLGLLIRKNYSRDESKELTRMKNHPEMAGTILDSD